MKPDSFIKSFPRREWALYNTGYPVFVTPHAVAPAQEFAKKYGIGNDTVIFGSGARFDWLFDKQQLDAFAEKNLLLFLKKGWRLYGGWKTRADRFASRHARLRKTDLSTLSNRELQSAMRSYYAAFLSHYTPSNIIEPISYYFQHSLQSLLVRASVSAGQSDALIASYAVPARESYAKRCSRDVSRARKKDAARLVEKYHYVFNSYAGEGKVTFQALQRFAKQLALSQHRRSKLPRIGNRKAQQLLDLLQVVATIQDVRKEHSLLWVSGVTQFLRELQRRFGIPLSALMMATWTECMHSTLPSLQQLASRRNGWVVVWSKNGETLFEGENAKKLFALFYRHVVKGDPNAARIMGVGASGGVARGRAVVVLNISHFYKVRKGDILVTVMTRPEYLPVLHRASAFITDEGGITCHAAIVAREMKKPCVIGAKVATKIIKDGDRIEVDGTKGVVRRI